VRGSRIKRRTEVKSTLLIGRIEASKAPTETHTPLIRYFINDIGPELPRWRMAGATAFRDEVDMPPVRGPGS